MLHFMASNTLLTSRFSSLSLKILSMASAQRLTAAPPSGACLPAFLLLPVFTDPFSGEIAPQVPTGDVLFCCVHEAMLLKLLGEELARQLSR